MLLHALVIALFGAPSGGSREGRAMWGALEVELPGAHRVTVPGLKLDRELLAPPVPATPSPVRVAPAVARPRRAVSAVRPEPARTQPAPAQEVAPLPAPSFPLLLDRIVPSGRKLELPPPLLVPPPAVEPAAESLPLPPIAPVVTPAPVEMPAPLPIERAPVETQALPVVAPTPPVEQPPVELKAIPVPVIESVVAPRIEPVPVAPSQPPASVRPEPVEVPAAERLAPVEAPPKLDRDPPGKSPAASGEGVAPRQEEPSSTFDPTAPRLDLDALRKRAGQIAREGFGQRAILPFPMPPVPERKSKLEAAIENARKPDCRTAYQALGLAAIVPLLANEIGEGNCRW